MRRILSITLLCLAALTATAQNFTYSKRFYFAIGSSTVDETLRDNRATVDSVLLTLRNLKQTGASDVRLHIASYASLESSDAYNAELAFKRTNALASHLKRFQLVEDSTLMLDANVFDWAQLIDLTEHSDCPNKQEALRIMRTIPSTPSVEGNPRKDALQQLDGGLTYAYMREYFFPEMRNSAITITANVPVQEVETYYREYEEHTSHTEWLFPRRGVVALRTNMLYDLLAIPNIGIDAYVTDNVSIGANWMYAWWNNDKKNIYWRTYGGDIHADYWFNNEHLWQGHHLGAYGQMTTYDFEWKKDGVLAPRYSWGGGITYGYAWWLNEHFSIDFALSAGYLGGKYYKYRPGKQDDIYYWKETNHLHWFGPTKLEVSLIWKLGKEK